MMIVAFDGLEIEEAFRMRGCGAELLVTQSEGIRNRFGVALSSKVGVEKRN